jgi:hypothetical protein
MRHRDPLSQPQKPSRSYPEHAGGQKKISLGRILYSIEDQGLTSSVSRILIRRKPFTQ